LIFEWTLIVFTVYKEFTYKNVENQNMELSIKFCNTIVGQIVVTTERGLALAVIHPNTDCARRCLISSSYLFIYFYYYVLFLNTLSMFLFDLAFLYNNDNCYY
jgi:hypothetical protein